MSFTTRNGRVTIPDWADITIGTTIFLLYASCFLSAPMLLIGIWMGWWACGGGNCWMLS